MAHTLGLQVVAEGVETSKQAGFLEEINCRTMQGYFFSKALRAEDTIPFLQHRQCNRMEYCPAADRAAAEGMNIARA